jgi:hypothetical protein
MEVRDMGLREEVTTGLEMNSEILFPQRLVMASLQESGVTLQIQDYEINIRMAVWDLKEDLHRGMVEEDGEAIHLVGVMDEEGMGHEACLQEDSMVKDPQLDLGQLVHL